MHTHHTHTPTLTPPLMHTHHTPTPHTSLSMHTHIFPHPPYTLTTHPHTFPHTPPCTLTTHLPSHLPPMHTHHTPTSPPSRAPHPASKASHALTGPERTAQPRPLKFNTAPSSAYPPSPPLPHPLLLGQGGAIDKAASVRGTVQEKPRGKAPDGRPSSPARSLEPPGQRRSPEATKPGDGGGTWE
uniref:Velvet complex subunit 2-like n=1 Tax=Phascolarctos cinereus TaxID=38626 RepID=A0A6P5K3Q0_PHACI|nr:velvet complex subunit 2-like [Phascolarctos cinereus]